ncbi:AMP-binding protein [Aequorivita ciconiae]|nr:AMP-binding protein [Aequorivita sp. H23M31]
MSAEELERIQSENLKKILQYASENVPYYRDLNLDKDADLSDFPILTKAILRTKSNQLISDKYHKNQLETNHSSGSSGEQSFTYMSFDHKFYLRALQTHWWMWGGYKPGEFMLQAGISPKRSFPKKLKDLFFRVQYMNAFKLKQDEITEQLKLLEKKDPKHLAGYPSALNEIALLALSNNKIYHFKSLISYGDKLFGHYRKNFENAFQNPTIINTYGCAEGLLMACQADLPYYYIMSPHVFLEVVNENGEPVPDGERGHILVTSLSSFSMPLIRYRLGDLGVLLPKSLYPSHRKFNYPLLQEVTGRETEIIKAPNGNILTVHSFTGILEYVEEIKQFKIIQISKIRLVVEYQTDSGVKLPFKVENEVHDKLLDLVEGTMDITFNLVEKIAASPSGKPQIIEIQRKN